MSHIESKCQRSEDGKIWKREESLKKAEQRQESMVLKEFHAVKVIGLEVGKGIEAPL